MPTAYPSETDPGVMVPLLPERITDLAPLINDGHAISDPPMRDDRFAPGEYGGRLILASVGDPKSFNVIVANESSSTDIINRMWAALTSYNQVTQEVIPGLAHAWEHDEAGSTWTFHLREGLVFSDGSPLTSEAVDRYFRVIYTEGLTNPNADVFNIDGVPFTWETPDDLTIVIHTPDTFAPMPLLANYIQPLPPEPWETALASDDPAAALAQIHTLDTDPSTYVCSGPFMLESFTSGEQTVIRRNPNYQRWDAAGRRLPNFDQMIFRSTPDMNTVRLRFEAGEADMIDPIYPQHYAALRDGAEGGGYTVWDLGLTLSKSFFWFNLKEGIDPDTGEPFVPPHRMAWFQNVDFRRACAHAIDREAMCDIVYSGRAVPKVAYESSSNLYWFNPNATRYDYNPERARELLDSIGLIDRNGDGIREDAEGNPVRFTMLTNRGNDVRERMIVLIQEDLRAIGIDMVPSTIDFSTLVERIADTYRYEACLLGLAGGTPDPTTGLNVLRSSGRTHQWNPSQDIPATEAEARIDELCDDLLRTLDREEQRQIYFEIQEIIARECFLIWTVDAYVYVGTQNRVANWCPAIVDDRTMWNIESLWQLSAD
ncbi:ABC transporter substrate-binding protein, partial [Candidatus Sumerlaeota bacterium]|nr:ABC transporter substrate-binding protein [Candidatus Sumerlaeota bacterium]